jgi:hypothetical protein
MFGLQKYVNTSTDGDVIHIVSCIKSDFFYKVTCPFQVTPVFLMVRAL